MPTTSRSMGRCQQAVRSGPWACLECDDRLAARMAYDTHLARVGSLRLLVSS